MEEVIDCMNVTKSPEELAINFLMRHARCRMALTGWTDENTLQQALAGSGLDTPAVRPAAADLSAPAENLMTTAMPAPAVAGDDSCAARFSRAYVAARHMSASRHTMTRAGKAA
ncbi:hypothetical protein B0E47_10975 [Rhodanobacter sp. B05]|uniref:hypothetical protein n=1 Tax=Rhodanobacter sp. B05 TaxID=1945859 RepID=UPI000985CC69|nr:hypothetical protein [Rhodanobacter sp. B05]OOG54593.1 hypothetical protein B0E47_10975 [Rhodanobacter sp. B05]